MPDARLVLVGDGPERESLGSLHVEGVELVGFRDDVPEWLAAANVVVLPSRWEGMSEVMLEAMAHGRSVVATEVPGAREVLGESAGEVVAVEDEGTLAVSIAERLRDPGLAAAEGAAGRAIIAERHDARSGHRPDGQPLRHSARGASSQRVSRLVLVEPPVHVDVVRDW